MPRYNYFTPSSDEGTPLFLNHEFDVYQDKLSKTHQPLQSLSAFSVLTKVYISTMDRAHSPWPATSQRETSSASPRAESKPTLCSRGWHALPKLFPTHQGTRADSAPCKTSRTMGEPQRTVSHQATCNFHFQEIVLWMSTLSNRKVLLYKFN